MYDAIVLAGGAARRMQGADKPSLRVGDLSMLDRVVAAVSGAARTVVVGPVRALAREVTWAREQPPGGGPVAAIAAAMRAVRSESVVVLAADLPDIAPAVPALLDALGVRPAAEVACLVDPGGRVNYLAAAWRTPALRTALRAVGDTNGAPARALLAGREMIALPDPAGWGRDCDTWDDLAAARNRATD